MSATIELAFDADGRILGLRLHMLANIGAYIASDRQLLTPFGQIGTVIGVYDIRPPMCGSMRCCPTRARPHPIAAPAAPKQSI